MMTKTYKHKMLGHTAIDREDGFYRVEDVLNNFISSIPKRTVEVSSDREVVEKDWVDDVIKSYYKRINGNCSYTGEEVLRQEIEKHAPKQKKITEEQFKQVASDNNWGYRSLYMNRLWGLLYDNNLIEDFEY